MYESRDDARCVLCCKHTCYISTVFLIKIIEGMWQYIKLEMLLKKKNNRGTVRQWVAALLYCHIPIMNQDVKPDHTRSEQYCSRLGFLEKCCVVWRSDIFMELKVLLGASWIAVAVSVSIAVSFLIGFLSFFPAWLYLWAAWDLPSLLLSFIPAVKKLL